MQKCLQPGWEESMFYEGGKQIGELKTVRSKHCSLCSQRDISGAFGMHNIGKKNPFSIFFLANLFQSPPRERL